mmetsp:Transcript_4393/g.10519  ORF Transcript_4393/g.10519 Transcript_4393/m.10519 type:complete len:318 (-) Transcript_4393:406-1359(-)
MTSETRRVIPSKKANGSGVTLQRLGRSLRGHLGARQPDLLRKVPLVRAIPEAQLWVRREPLAPLVLEGVGKVKVRLRRVHVRHIQGHGVGQRRRRGVDGCLRPRPRRIVQRSSEPSDGIPEPAELLQRTHPQVLEPVLGALLIRRPCVQVAAAREPPRVVLDECEPCLEVGALEPFAAPHAAVRPRHGEHPRPDDVELRALGHGKHLERHRADGPSGWGGLHQRGGQVVGGARRPDRGARPHAQRAEEPPAPVAHAGSVDELERARIVVELELPPGDRRGIAVRPRVEPAVHHRSLACARDNVEATRENLLLGCRRG